MLSVTRSNSTYQLINTRITCFGHVPRFAWGYASDACSEDNIPLNNHSCACLTVLVRPRRVPNRLLRFFQLFRLNVRCVMDGWRHSSGHARDQSQRHPARRPSGARAPGPVLPTMHGAPQPARPNRIVFWDECVSLLLFCVWSRVSL